VGTVQSKNLMQELKLTGMLEQYENTLLAATAGGIGHGDFLDLLLQSEVNRLPAPHSQNFPVW